MTLKSPSTRSRLGLRFVGSLGAIWNLARKVWVRVSFLHTALSRPRITLQRHHALGRTVIEVYSMGKVGSSTIYYSLLRTFPFARIFHNHFLSNEWILRRLPGTPFTRNIRLAKAALQVLTDPACSVCYVVLMRDPVARDLSNVIQNYVNLGIDILDRDLEAVIEEIKSRGHTFFAEWFDTEFGGHFGFAVTDLPFDAAKGWSLHQLDARRRLLLITAETLDTSFQPAVSALLNVEIDPQFRFNDSEDKLEVNFYKMLKSRYKLDQSALDAVYDHRIVRLFYTTDQIARFRARWGTHG